jgi:hypothetical protein
MLIGPVLKWWSGGVLRGSIFPIHYAINPFPRYPNFTGSKSFITQVFSM